MAVRLQKSPKPPATIMAAPPLSSIIEIFRRGAVFGFGFSCCALCIQRSAFPRSLTISSPDLPEFNPCQLECILTTGSPCGGLTQMTGLSNLFSMRTLCLLLCFIVAASRLSSASLLVTAVGHDSRVNLSWEAADGGQMNFWNVYRSEKPEGPFQKLNLNPLAYTVFSDFLGENEKACYYRVTKLRDTEQVSTSQVALAISRPMSDEELITSVQEATFRYFWDYAHPVSGLAREALGSGDKVTIGGSGSASWG